MASGFTGMVLTGGTSTRMGSDKAFVEVDGRPLAAIARDALVGAGAAETFAVGGDRERLEAAGFQVVPDEFPGTGPLGAIATGLSAANFDPVVVLACDLPRVQAATVNELLTALSDAADDAAIPLRDGRREVLVAAYRRRCLPTLRAAFDA